MNVRVRASETRVPVVRSKAELETIVKRYGAAGFSVSENYATGIASVSFVLPDTPGDRTVRIPVRIPVETLRVFNAIHSKRWTVTEAQRHSEMWGKAERVAWRNLVLWVTAALSAATLGLQTVSEAFFAHAIVGDAGERMIEVVEREQSRLGAGVQRLLTSGAES